VIEQTGPLLLVSRVTSFIPLRITSREKGRVKLLRAPPVRDEKGGRRNDIPQRKNWLWKRVLRIALTEESGGNICVGLSTIRTFRSSTLMSESPRSKGVRASSPQVFGRGENRVHRREKKRQEASQESDGRRKRFGQEVPGGEKCGESGRIQIDNTIPDLSWSSRHAHLVAK